MESDMKSLISRLESEIEQLQKCREFKQEYKPNTLGIVQTHGLAIDINCSKLGALYEAKELLNGLDK